MSRDLSNYTARELQGLKKDSLVSLILKHKASSSPGSRSSPKVSGRQSESNPDSDQSITSLKISDLKDIISTCVSEANASFVQRIENLEDQVANLQNEISTLKSERSNEVPGGSVGSDVIHDLRQSIVEQIREDNDRISRKKNLVVRGLPEESGKSDSASFSELCAETLGITLAPHCVSIKRVGQQHETRPRLLIVSFSDLRVRNEVLKKAPLLRTSTSRGGNVFINPDLTRTQLEEQFRLRQEVRRLRAEGKYAVIKRGCIISKN